MNLLSQIESILFVASKPLAPQIIAKALGVKESEVAAVVEALKIKYNRDRSGIHILQEGNEIQMATNANNAEAVEAFIKEEAVGELTRPQLETLTVIAYRGPVTRPELEQIRGVNCALILRNLLVRGLIEEEDDAEKLGMTYRLSFEALRHLGIKEAAELPEHQTWHAHEYVERVLENEETCPEPGRRMKK